MNRPVDPKIQMQVDPNEDTEWNDILRAHGIIPEKEKDPTEQLEEALAEAVQKQHENRLENKTLDELDELEDDEDEEFLQQVQAAGDRRVAGLLCRAPHVAPERAAVPAAGQLARPARAPAAGREVCRHSCRPRGRKLPRGQLPDAARLPQGRRRQTGRHARPARRQPDQTCRPGIVAVQRRRRG
ncbi:hypothetical protein KL909_004165 [Ogataea angusta]|nr:hypothetical protein KL909_004165 [Ogataea angusta]